MRIQERSCRVCGGRLDSVLDLGYLALSNFPLSGDPPSATVPFNFCQCGECGLVQLRHTVDPEVLFRHYWYRSGINEMMRAELRDVVKQAQDVVGGLVPGDAVIDIGANDGTLLSYLPGCAFRIAFEPALNLHADLRSHADLIVPTFFPADRGVGTAEARLIFSIACFYDLDDPKAFVAAIARLLAPDGAWVVQFQDLHQMTQATAVDNICGEHLVYYSLGSFERLITPYGLRVTHAERRAINGGSYRLIVQHEAKRVDGTVEVLRQFEQGCEHWHTLERFAWRVGEVRHQIQSALGPGQQVIDVYGASTKFNTLSQYVGLGPELIRQAWERSDAKWGRVTATGIPIVSEAVGRQDPPDLLLVGIWQFREAVLAREKAYLDQGGTILFPLPEVDLVRGRGGRT